MTLSTAPGLLERSRTTASRWIVDRASGPGRRSAPHRAATRAPRAPRSDEPTLRELAGQAAVVLRHRLGRPPAVVALPLSVPLAPVARRPLSAVLLVALIAVATAWLSWSAWHAAQDYRVRLAGPASPHVRVLEVELEQRQQTATLTRRSPGTGSGRAPAAAPADRAEADDGFSLPGPLLGAAFAGSVVLLGAAAGRTVWRRTARAVPLPGAPAAPDGATRDEVEEDGDASIEDDDPADGQPDDEDAGPEDADHPEIDYAELEEPSADTLVDQPAGDRDRPTTDAAEDVAPTPAHESATPAGSVLRGRAGNPGRDGAAAGGQLLDGEDAAGGAAGAVPSDEGAGKAVAGAAAWVYAERIFERRRATRVHVDLSGVLRWREDERVVRVLDVSESGLRLRVDGPLPLADPARRLREREPVRLDVPTAHGRLVVGAQVSWRNPVNGGVEVGVQFTALTADASNVLAAVVADALQPQAAPA